MYSGKDGRVVPLFEELFPFGGQLEEDNRWLRIADLIPWRELEREYNTHFSHLGRPETDSRLFLGLILLKHLTGRSDREVVQSVRENVYQQAFCGFEEFVTDSALEPSTLTKLRKRLGVGFFKSMEEKTHQLLIERKIIGAKGMLADATVFPEHVKHPNDVGLLNDVRKWLVGNIKTLGGELGRTCRTSCRKAKQSFLSFSKQKRRSRQMVRRAQKEMLQFVRRNLGQLEELVGALEERGRFVEDSLRERLETGRRIFEQQMEMYRERKHRVDGRIVSFHRDYVRPIKRGKGGRKDTEFGPKGALSHVGGFLFLDKFSHDNYSEATREVVDGQLAAYQQRFGKLPPSFTADRLYGTRENHRLMKERGVRASFKPLGRPKDDGETSKRWFKKKQRERNRIEGSFGHGKNHCGLDCVRYHGVEGAEMWIRASILGMNLKTALARV